MLAILDKFFAFADAHILVLTALYIIHVGVALIFVAKGDSDVSHVGESLIVLGAGILRFERKEPK
jgi:hypothetical protein